jgi:hypothetical protein
MKELHAPWVFWDVRSLPGAEDVIGAHPEVMGTSGTGADLETKVTGGSSEWNRTRVSILKKRGAQEVLRPLFCTIAINLQTTGQEPGKAVSVSPGLLVDGSLSFFSVRVSPADYAAALTAIGLNIVKPSGALPGGAQARDVQDTPFAFIAPQRSTEDTLYQDQLVAQAVVDDDFVKDVLDVDFTRPVFSGTRCNLLKFAPDLPESKMTPDDFRNGFVANLRSATDEGASKLLASLQDPNDQQAHVQEVTAFVNACRARPPSHFIADALEYASHVRSIARANRIHEDADDADNGIIEFDATLPRDEFTTDSPTEEHLVRFDPVTCNLERR